ncbi:hypothetical protein DIPPA_22368 [Diplonema papillatum]|nr:hypothetical protein DIPPA_22368 [Diplonema papillatum]
MRKSASPARAVSVGRRQVHDEGAVTPSREPRPEVATPSPRHVSTRRVERVQTRETGHVSPWHALVLVFLPFYILAGDYLVPSEFGPELGIIGWICSSLIIIYCTRNKTAERYTETALASIARAASPTGSIEDEVPPSPMDHPAADPAVASPLMLADSLRRMSPGPRTPDAAHPPDVFTSPATFGVYANVLASAIHEKDETIAGLVEENKLVGELRGKVTSLEAALESAVARLEFDDVKKKLDEARMQLADVVEERNDLKMQSERRAAEENASAIQQQAEELERGAIELREAKAALRRQMEELRAQTTEQIEKTQADLQAESDRAELLSSTVDKLQNELSAQKKVSARVLSSPLRSPLRPTPEHLTDERKHEYEDMQAEIKKLFIVRGEQDSRIQELEEIAWSYENDEEDLKKHVLGLEENLARNIEKEVENFDATRRLERERDELKGSISSLTEALATRDETVRRLESEAVERAKLDDDKVLESLKDQANTAEEKVAQLVKKVTELESLLRAERAGRAEGEECGELKQWKKREEEFRRAYLTLAFTHEEDLGAISEAFKSQRVTNVALAELGPQEVEILSKHLEAKRHLAITLQQSTEIANDCAEGLLQYLEHIPMTVDRVAVRTLQDDIVQKTKTASERAAELPSIFAGILASLPRGRASSP